MADSILESNTSSKRVVSGSLARRAVFIALTFIVVPLLFYTFFMYFYEYENRKKELFGSLIHITKEKHYLINEFAELEHDSLFFINNIIINQKVYESNSVLKEIKEYKEAEAVFYLTFEGGKLICTASSNKEMVGKNFSDIANIIQLKNKIPHIFSMGNNIIFSLPISSMESINIAFNAVSFFNKLPALSISNAPMLSGILDAQGRILASSQKSLLGEYFEKNTKDEAPIQFEPLKNIENGYKLTVHNEKYFAIIWPIEGSSLSVFSAITAKWIYSQIYSYLFHIAILLLFILFIGGLVTFLATIRISRPMKELCNVMQKVGKGNLSARFSEDRMGFEINVIGRIFNRMIASLIHYMEETKELETQKEILEKELLIGHEVQKSILPKEIPPFPGLDLAAGFFPAKEVGGDFYDVLLMEDQNLMLSVADTSGKGIFACLYSLTFRSILRSFVFKYKNLKEAVMQANNLFCEDTKDSGVFVTAWIGIYHPQEKKIVYASCGHPAGVLKKADGAVLELSTKVMALGVEKFSEVEISEIYLEKGDTILLFTDGITDAVNDKNEMYGYKKFKDIFTKEDRKSSREYIDLILNDVFTFSKGKEQFDDITIFSIRQKE